MFAATERFSPRHSAAPISHRRRPILSLALNTSQSSCASSSHACPSPTFVNYSFPGTAHESALDTDEDGSEEGDDTPISALKRSPTMHQGLSDYFRRSSADSTLTTIQKLASEQSPASSQSLQEEISYSTSSSDCSNSESGSQNSNISLPACFDSLAIRKVTVEYGRFTPEDWLNEVDAEMKAEEAARVFHSMLVEKERPLDFFERHIRLGKWLRSSAIPSVDPTDL